MQISIHVNSDLAIELTPETEIENSVLAEMAKCYRTGSIVHLTETSSINETEASKFTVVVGNKQPRPGV